MNLTNTPTEAAVMTAIKNAEKMHGNYTSKQVNGTLYIVQHDNDAKKTYAVDIYEGYEHCQCLYFADNGTCKHLRFVHETNRIDAEEAKLADPDYIGYAA